MARTVRDVALANRTARSRLRINSKPYWRSLETGLHLGYRRHERGGTWVARRRNEAGRYLEAKLGRADDLQDADGVAVLDFSQAQRAARLWWANEQRYEQGVDSPTAGPYTVKNAIDDYVDDYKRRGGKALSCLKYTNKAHIDPQLGHLPVSKLTSRRVQDWHRAVAEGPKRLRTVKDSDQKIVAIDQNDTDAVRARRATANRVLTVFKAALNFAWRNSRVPSDDAWRRVKPFKSVDAPVVSYLNSNDVTRLLSVCEGSFKDLVHAAVLTGCRYGELCRLSVGDFDPHAAVLLIRTAKGGQPRHVTLTAEGVALFHRLAMDRGSGELLLCKKDGAPWKASHQIRPLAVACGRAKIEPAISFHVLRHTHASFLAMKGVPMAVIAKQLGHSDTRMTERHYAHLAPNYVSDTIRAAFPQLEVTDSAELIPLRKKVA